MDAARAHVPDTLNTIILGIIEGITEFLPVSSTGHLLIAEQLLGARSELFNVAIQAGAILAIVLIYRRRLLELLTGFDEAEQPRLSRQAQSSPRSSLWWAVSSPRAWDSNCRRR